MPMKMHESQPNANMPIAVFRLKLQQMFGANRRGLFRVGAGPSARDASVRFGPPARAAGGERSDGRGKESVLQHRVGRHLADEQEEPGGSGRPLIPGRAHRIDAGGLVLRAKADQKTRRAASDRPKRKIGGTMILPTVDPLIATGVVLSTAATDAVYVLFTASVSARRRFAAASWSSVWYLLSAFAVISYTSNLAYVAFAAAGSWIGGFLSITALDRFAPMRRE